MKIYNQPVELIIEIPPVNPNSKTPFNLKKGLEDGGVPITKISKKVSSPQPKGSKLKAAAAQSPGPQKTHVQTKIKDTAMNPWDVAHMAAKALGQSTFVEPDLLQEFVADQNIDVSFKKMRDLSNAPATKSISENGFDPDWLPKQNIIWHLGDKFSQLKSAREAVANIEYTIRIGHLDTGYNQTHKVIPDSIRKNKLQRNFVEGETQDDAHDPKTTGLLRNPGHGTGTLGILAGTKIKINTDEGVFNDFLGGAPFAEVICCRISPTVVLIKTSAFADALNYLTGLSKSGTQVHVVSMSMGGAPTKSWADAVNAAYDAGITVVTASGNNFNGLPTKHVIYPARFERVIAACGVTNDFKPYHSGKLGEMQGCYGPERHMDRALAAFTPNTPWASGDDSIIMFSGAGTSSATPQIAAAAAIYYRKYHKELDALQPWQRVEAIRNALYKSAFKKGDDKNFKNNFGNGIIQAKNALDIAVNKDLKKTPEDTVPWFPIITTMFKAMPAAKPNNRLLMFNTELAQLVFNYPELSAIIDNNEVKYENIPSKKWAAFTDAVIAHPAASLTLKKFLMTTHKPK
ncbi:MAG: S8/S53 family peptidase [Chitinophagaceae bacterium]